MIDRSPNKAWQVRDNFMSMKPFVSVATKKTWWLIHTSEGDWTQLILAKTSGTFFRVREKNWPIADRVIPEAIAEHIFRPQLPSRFSKVRNSDFSVLLIRRYPVK